MKQKLRLVIIGAGGFGREVAWQMTENTEFMENYEFIGYVDDDERIQHQKIGGAEVLGTMEWLLAQTDPIAALIAVGSARVRKKIAEKCKTNEKIVFPTFIAEDFQCSDSVKIGKGCILCKGNIATVDTKIGDFTLINLSCTIGHDVVLKEFVTLYPGVHVSGNVTIGSVTEIGTGANIIQGKTIGDQVIVGAGSVVVTDIENSCTAVGVPAKKIK